MKTATLSGVPLALQQDSWWMEGHKAPPPEDNPKRWSRDMRGPMLLLALLAFGDAMIWKVSPGLSLAVFALSLVGAAVLMASSLSPRRAVLAGVVALFAVAPVVELVQPLSLLLLILGLITSLCIIANVPAADFTRALSRFPFVAFLQALRDSRTSIAALSLRGIRVGEVVTGWLLPLGLGLVFLLLLIGANPIVSEWGGRIDLPQIGVDRALFWVCLLAVIMSSLSANALTSRLAGSKRAKPRALPGFFNAPAVTRSLVLFNLLFAVQTAMDLTFLTGSTDLPYGMTYAEYAHRGAYPLLATGLLAGAFAVLARPFSDESHALRVLMLVWLCQTLLLVGSSALRLDIYIEAYGLTRLRFAAAIWMGVVGLGLALVAWQVLKRHKTGWMLARCTGLGLGTLYLCAFVNIDGLIAQHNLSNEITRDDHYVCELSEAAVVELMRTRGTRAENHCWNRYRTPVLSTPADWREWGFRNWRLRRSLSTRQMETTP